MISPKIHDRVRLVEAAEQEGSLIGLLCAANALACDIAVELSKRARELRVREQDPEHPEDKEP